MKRLLLITYEFPPKGGPGVHRPLKMAKYLSRLGWDVSVLTVKNPMAGMVDESLLGEVPEGVEVIRAWSLEPTRLIAVVRSLRSRLRRAPQSPPTVGRRGYTSMPSWFIRLIQAFFIPDEKVGWTPWALRAAKRAHAASPFDVIVATGPPFSAMGVAWRLSREFDIPWVADLRDPIVGGYFFRPPTALHAWAIQRYERLITERAAWVVTTSGGFTGEIVGRYPALADRSTTLTNGYDPEDFANLEPAEHEGFVLAYVGTFQGTVNPETLFRAIQSLRDTGSTVLEHLRVRFVGAVDGETSALIAQYGMDEIVERPGYMSHDQALQEMVSADVLFEVRGLEPESRGMIPGKLLEYLAAGPPILALLPPDGAAAAVVEHAKAGVVVRSDDTEAIASALQDLHERWCDGVAWERDTEAAGSYDRSVIVDRLAEILERLVGEEDGAS